MTFRKYPSINRFPSVMKEIQYAQSRGDDLSSVIFTSQVKLHGTNAAIVFSCSSDNVITAVRAQKRGQFITPENDNFGFADYVERFVKPIYINKHITDISRETVNFSNGTACTIYLYGEWAGPGIQKGVAISQIPEKTFCFFGVHIELSEPVEVNGKKWESISINYTDFDIFDIIPRSKRIDRYKTYEVDMTSPDSITTFMDEVNADVLDVENCCPFTKEHWGIEGIGEGLVLFTLTDKHQNFMFKAKGDKHAVTKQSKPVEKDFMKITKVTAFVNAVVTENRVQQGIDELGLTELKQIPDSIKWVLADVYKECQGDLETSGLGWDDVRKQVSNIAAKTTKEILSNQWKNDL